jgi:hypothetical protein
MLVYQRVIGFWPIPFGLTTTSWGVAENRFFLGDWSLRPEWNEVHLREFAWGFSDSKPCQDNIASHKDFFRLLCQWLAATSTKLSILYCASSGTTWHDIRKIVQNCAPLNPLAPLFQSENVRTLKTRPQSFGNKFVDIDIHILYNNRSALISTSISYPLLYNGARN